MSNLLLFTTVKADFFAPYSLSTCIIIRVRVSNRRLSFIAIYVTWEESSQLLLPESTHQSDLPLVLCSFLYLQRERLADTDGQGDAPALKWSISLAWRQTCNDYLIQKDRKCKRNEVLRQTGSDALLGSRMDEQGPFTEQWGGSTSEMVLPSMSFRIYFGKTRLRSFPLLCRAQKWKVSP